MLESEIKAVYEEMADSELPPSPISIPAATRRGRIRRGLHRSGIIAAPVLAAAAVLGIALSGALPGGLFRSGPAAARPIGPAPARFPLLRPYAAFGWVPALGSVTEMGGQSSTYLLLDGPGGTLSAYSAGRCHVRHHMLMCPGFTLPPQTAHQVPPYDVRLGRMVGSIAGQPAYWNVQSPTEGTLSWQYARGGWATLVEVHRSANLRTALHIARSIRFGRAVAPPQRFSFQLINLPADWHLYEAGSGGTQGAQHDFDNGASFTTVAGGYAAFSAMSPYKNDCATGFPHPATTLHINGQTVEVGRVKSQGTVDNWLCAPDADGEFFFLNLGSHPQISATDLFAHHLRLLGPDPAHWTTQLIG